MVRLLRTPAAFLIVLGAVLACAASAHAYSIGGARWPGSPARITYYDSTPARYHWAVEQAAEAWNTSGVRVRFVKVSSPSRAGVTISADSRLGSGAGYATVGYAPHAFIELYMGTSDQWTLAATAAHEMGHILGLEHVYHRCALMTPSTYVSCNPEWPPHSWQWRCRVLQQDDLNGARVRYGGTPKLRPSMWCDKEPKASAVASLTVTQLTSDPLKIARVTATLPATHVASVSVLRRAGTCPTGPSDVSAEPVGLLKGKPGASVSVTDTTFTALAAGTYCYRAFSYDIWDRAGGSRSANLDYTGPPAVPVSNVIAVAQNTNPRPGPGLDPVLLDITVTTPTLAWVDGADVWMKQGSCPTAPEDGESLGSVAAGVGVHQLYGATIPAAGSWCVAAFTFDGSLRSATSSGTTITFTYTPPTSSPPTNVQVHRVNGDVTLTWNWPNPVPTTSTIARFEGACTGTITVQDVFDNAWEWPDTGIAGTWTDYSPVTGTYCAALITTDAWGYNSAVVKTEYTVP